MVGEDKEVMVELVIKRGKIAINVYVVLKEYMKGNKIIIMS